MDTEVTANSITRCDNVGIKMLEKYVDSNVEEYSPANIGYLI